MLLPLTGRQIVDSWIEKRSDGRWYVRRRVLTPPAEPSPYVQPTPQHEPAKVEPEKVP